MHVGRNYDEVFMLLMCKQARTPVCTETDQSVITVILQRHGNR